MRWLLVMVALPIMTSIYLFFQSDATISHVHTVAESIAPLATLLAVVVAAIGWGEQAKFNGREARATAKTQAELTQAAVDNVREAHNNAHRGYLRMRVIRCWGMLYEGTGVKPYNADKITQLNEAAEEAFWQQETFAAFSYDAQGKLQEVFDAIRVDVFLLNSAIEKYNEREEASEVVKELLSEIGPSNTPKKPVPINYFQRTLFAFESIFTDVFPDAVFLSQAKARIGNLHIFG